MSIPDGYLSMGLLHTSCGRLGSLCAVAGVSGSGLTELRYMATGVFHVLALSQGRVGWKVPDKFFCAQALLGFKETEGVFLVPPLWGAW